MDKINIDVSSILDTVYKKNFGKNIFLFVMGLLISALSFNLFFAPYNVVPTGSSGLSFLISKLSGIDVSLVTFGVSCILLITF